MTLDFELAADEVHVLVVNDAAPNMSEAMKAATSTLLAAQIDILVYCDIGLEPVSYYLAFQRISRVQVVTLFHHRLVADLFGSSTHFHNVLICS